MIRNLLVTGGSRGPGAAQKVALALLWLFGNEASCTTGTLLDVGGGR